MCRITNISPRDKAAAHQPQLPLVVVGVEVLVPEPAVGVAGLPEHGGLEVLIDLRGADHRVDSWKKATHIV